MENWNFGFRKEKVYGFSFAFELPLFHYSSLPMFQSEYRNPKQIQNSNIKIQNFMFVWFICIWKIRACFEFRISCFEFINYFW